MLQVGVDNSGDDTEMPEENSNIVPSLSNFDVTRLSEEEMSTLREVLEREWVLHERNAKEKRCTIRHCVLIIQIDNGSGLMVSALDSGSKGPGSGVVVLFSWARHLTPHVRET